MGSSKDPAMLKGLLILVFGSLCASTAVIMIKLSHCESLFLAGARCLVAAAFLSPLYFYHRRKVNMSEYKNPYLRIFIPGVLLAIHFMSWIIGARMTPASNSSLIVNFVPIVMPFFMLGFGKERIKRNEIYGTIIATIGVIILFYNDIQLGTKEGFWGDVICFASMLSFCIYLLLARMNGDIPVIWLYVTPLYFVTGLVSMACSFIFRDPLSTLNTKEWYYILLLAVIPTIMGHSILNYSMKILRSQIVAIGNLSQCLFASVLAVYFLDEVPRSGFYLAALFLVLGLLVAVKKKPIEQQV